MARRGPNVPITGDARGLEKATRNAEGSLHKMSRGGGKALKGLGKAAGVAGLALGAGLVVGLKSVVEAAAESEKVVAQTNAVLKSTEGVANVTAKGVDNLAGALSRKSGIDDEAIASGQNMLLTFTNVRNEVGKGNDIFDQATKAALDLSVATGTDLKAANLQLGKALNDPAKGLSKLQRVGVTFTEQQKKQVEAMTEAGDVAGAQKVILKELGKEFGGSAAAAGDTFAGKMNKAKNALGNLQESIGGAVLPILSKGAQGLADFVSGFETGQGPVAGFANKVKEFAVGALSAVGPAVRNGIELVKGIAPTMLQLGRSVISAVGPAFKLAGQAIGQLQQIVLANLPQIKATLKDLGPVVRGLGNVFQLAFTAITQVLKIAGPGIKQALGGILLVVRGVMRVIGGILTGDFSKAWDGVKRIFAGATQVLLGILRGLLALIGRALGNLPSLIGRAFGAAWDAAKRLTVSALKAIGNLILRIPETYYGLMLRAGKAIGRGLATALSALPGIMRDGLEAASRLLTSLPGKFGRAGVDAAQALVGGIRKVPSLLGNALGGVGGIVSSIGEGLRKWLNAKTLFGNRVRIKIPGPAPDIDFNLPSLSTGGRIGGASSGGDRIPALLKGTEVVLNQRQQALVATGMSISEALDATGAPTIGGSWRGYAKGGKSSAQKKAEAAAKKQREAEAKKRQAALDRAQARYDYAQSAQDISNARAEGTTGTADDDRAKKSQIRLITAQLATIAKLRKKKGLTRAQKTGLNQQEAGLRGTLNGLRTAPADLGGGGGDQVGSVDPGDDPAAQAAAEAAAAALEAQNRANELAEQMLAATRELNDLVASQVSAQQRIESLVQTQGPQMLAAFTALLSGDIGGQVGRALGTPSYPGGLASY